MSEVKRSTEHSLELGNITLKIAAPGAVEISIYTKEPSYSNYMRLRIADIENLRSALLDFVGWLKSPSQESK